jgi:lysophospholipase L1-like esterase
VPGMQIRILVLLALLACVCGPAAYAAPATPANPCALVPPRNHLVADATELGVISLRFYDADGARVVFFECVGDRAERLGASRVAPDPATNPATALVHAARWSCTRLVRRFAAIATLPDGTLALGAYSVRTVSCAQRFALGVRRHVAPGAKLRVRVVDRWGIGGIRPQLCIAPPHAAPACRKLAFPDAVTVGVRRFRAATRGRWGVELRVRHLRVRAAVRVGGGTIAPAAEPPAVLATGDSTMQGIDSFLSDELGDAATVHSDARPGSGVSRGDFWTRLAASQTKRLRQRVTVISVGAATDGMPLTTPSGARADCCDEPWVAAYSLRVRKMMRIYLRRGHARVFWLTPPLPAYPPRAQITNAIDDAVVRAATGLAGVVVGRVDRYFSPGGRFQDAIRYRGRLVRVRESDGVHLNIAGTAIVAQLLAPAIRQALDEPASR